MGGRRAVVGALTAKPMVGGVRRAARHAREAVAGLTQALAAGAFVEHRQGAGPP
jgi:hypothetical protein